MSRIIRLYMLFALALLAGVIRAQAPAALPNPFPPDGVVCATLDNGLRLVVREEHSLPVVAIAVVVRGGSAAQANSRGIAHYLEHLVFQGTTHYPQGLAAQYALEQVGGISNAVTSRDATRFEAAVAADHADLLVKVMAEVTLHPLLTDEAFHKERPTILQEIQREGDNPVTTALSGAYQAAYAKHPYRNNPKGTLAEVLSLTPDEVRAFYHTWYVPNNMSVVLVGDITPQRAADLVQKEFVAAAAALPPLPSPETAAAVAAPLLTIDADQPDVYQVSAFPAPSSRDFPALVTTDLLVTLLVDGSEAMLPGWWARDGVQAAAFGGEFVSPRDPGRLLLWTRAVPADADRLHAATLSLLRSMAATPMPAVELEAAKQRLAAGFLRDNETYGQQAATLAFYEALGGDGALLATRYLETVQTITPAALSRAVPTDELARVMLGGTREKGQ